MKILNNLWKNAGEKLHFFMSERKAELKELGLASRRTLSVVLY